MAVENTEGDKYLPEGASGYHISINVMVPSFVTYIHFSVFICGVLPLGF